MAYSIYRSTSCHSTTSDNRNSTITALQSPTSFQELQQNQQQRKNLTYPRVKKPQTIAVPEQDLPSSPKVDSPIAIVRDEEIARDIRRGAPTDETRLNSHMYQTSSQIELNKKRSQYFDEVFSAREPYHTAQNRVNQDSIVVVTIKTNIQVNGAFAFISDFSFNLAQTFQRPESSIMVILDDNAHLILGSSDEPAYLATVSALPCMIGPVTNLRHTILIQDAIKETIGIPVNRGVVKFECIPEENFGTNGNTLRDEINKLERVSTEENSAIKNFSRTMSRKIKSNSSRASAITAQTNLPSTTLSPARRRSPKEESTENTQDEAEDKTLEMTGKERMLKKCKSFRHFFTR